MTQYAAWVTNKPVPFQRHRLALSSEAIKEGVVDATDYDVSQRAAGANMSVDVAIGKAFIAIDTQVRGGLAFAFSDAIENVAVNASDPTLPRVDQVVLQYNDTSIPAGVGGDVPTLRVVAGTPTSGATLDNRSGAAALPNDAVRLADVLVPAASTSVTNANIRDRRPWARGLFNRIDRTTNASAGNDYTTTATSYGLVDGTNLNPRIECSGVPLRMLLEGEGGHSVAANGVLIQPWLDSAQVGGLRRQIVFAAAGAGQQFTAVFEFTPAAGSHTLGPAWRVGTGTATLNARTPDTPLSLTIEEIVRQNANNV